MELHKEMSGGNEEREKERDLKDNGKIGEARHLISQVFGRFSFLCGLRVI